MNASNGNKVKSLTQRQCVVEENAQSTTTYVVRALLPHMSRNQRQATEQTYLSALLLVFNL